MSRIARKTQRWIETFISFMLALVIVALILAGAYAVATGAVL